MQYFITSSGTNIGKTFVTCALTCQLLQAGKNVAAFKPVISGFDMESLEESDTGQLLKVMDRELCESEIDHISPYRFKAPLSPHLAAAEEKRELSLKELLRWHALLRNEADIILIEGVGGVMVPLNNTHTTLDWIKELGHPTILVVGSYLGSLSHTLTAARALIQEKVPIHAVLVSESLHSTVGLGATVTSLRQFIPEARHVIGLPRVNRWQDLPPLLHLFP